MIPAFLGERYYVTFTLWHGPLVSLSSVRLLHLTQRVELNGSILTPLIA